MQNSDLISKAALKKEIQDVVLTVADTPLSNDYTSKLIVKMGELFRKKIDDAPGVDAAPVRHGRWIEVVEYDHVGDCSSVEYKCSECGRFEEECEPYCNCGAKMDGDIDATD